MISQNFTPSNKLQPLVSLLSPFTQITPSYNLAQWQLIPPKPLHPLGFHLLPKILH